MRTILRSLVICLFASATVATVATAQESQPAPAAATQNNPLSAHNKMMWTGLKVFLLRSAEKMPEESYGFRPAASVRTFGQLVGHVADSQYTFCSVVLGEKNPAPGIEKTKTAKADLVAALKEALAYCDKAYDGMTDATAVETVKLFGGDTPKLGVLNVHNAHGAEHYGNLATYMRMKDVVPPSSEPRTPQPKK